jgi:hypothetical protein
MSLTNAMNKFYLTQQKCLTILSLIYLINFLYATKTNAQDWNTIIKKVANDRNIVTSAGREHSDFFGNSVSVSGNYAVIGIRNDGDDVNGSNRLSSCGSALVFKNNAGTWTQIKKLTAATRAASDIFGFSVSISGDYIVVGAYQEDQDAAEANTISNAGCAYIFSRNEGGTDNWGQVKKLVGTSRNSSYNFGYSVSISGDDIIAGAPGENASYVFNRNQGGTNNWGVVKKLAAPVALTGDNFGYSVSISGNFVVVGAYLEDEDAAETNTLSNSGSAYVFSRDSGGVNNWGIVKKLTASTRAASDNFGTSVAVSGDVIVVGAHNEDQDALEANTLSNSGSAYVYTRNQGGTGNWGQVKKLTAGIRGASDNFGNTVSIAGDYILIGARNEDEDASELNTLSNSGSSYLFGKDQGGANNWGQVKKIVAGVREAEALFGSGVSISSDYIFVGAPQEDDDGNELNKMSNPGAAYIYEINEGGTNNWGQKQKISMIERTQLDYLGWTVAIDGDYAVAGALYDDEDASGTNANTKLNAGAAYVYKNISGTWTQIKKLLASDREEGDEFGIAVAISGDYIVVGADWEDNDAAGLNPVSSAGSAYIFSKNEGGADNWGQVKKITAPVRGVNDYFGFSVAVSGNDIVVGAREESEDASEANTIAAAGSAYIFNRDSGGINNWGLVKKITASTRGLQDLYGISVAISGDYIAVGSYLEDEDVSESNTLSASGSVYVYGRNHGGVNNWGQMKKITAPIRAVDDHFGLSIAISGDDLVVGAYDEDQDALEANAVIGAGSAYIFNRNQGGTNNWGQVKKIAAPVRNFEDYFGYAVAIYGNYIIVGAHNEDEDASESNALTDAGSVYIFNRDSGGVNNWGQVKKIVASIRSAGDKFGGGVGIYGDYIFIGAGEDSDDELEANSLPLTGSVYFVTSSAPLPVNLLGLTGEREKNASGQVTEYISLQWMTASEINNKGFEILAAANGEDFQKIGFVTGKGNSFNFTSYEFNSHWIKDGYFRLRQIDNDGQDVYSPVVFIKGMEKSLWNIYPNPNTGTFTIETNSISDAIPVSLLSIQGKEVWKGTLQEGRATVSNLDLPTGIYFLHTIDENEVKVMKVLID